MKRLSKVLGNPLSIDDMYDGWAGKPTSHDIAKQELFRLIEKDTKLKAIINEYNATRDTLGIIFEALCNIYNKKWIRGFYVPILALIFETTLSFILKENKELLASDSNRNDLVTQLEAYFKEVNIIYIIK